MSQLGWTFLEGSAELHLDHDESRVCLQLKFVGLSLETSQQETIPRQENDILVLLVLFFVSRRQKRSRVIV